MATRQETFRRKGGRFLETETVDRSAPSRQTLGLTAPVTVQPQRRAAKTNPRDVQFGNLLQGLTEQISPKAFELQTRGPQGLDFVEAFGPGRQSVRDRAARLNEGRSFDLRDRTNDPFADLLAQFGLSTQFGVEPSFGFAGPQLGPGNNEGAARAQNEALVSRLLAGPLGHLQSGQGGLASLTQPTPAPQPVLPTQAPTPVAPPVPLPGFAEPSAPAQQPVAAPAQQAGPEFLSDEFFSALMSGLVGQPNDLTNAMPLSDEFFMNIIQNSAPPNPTGLLETAGENLRGIDPIGGFVRLLRNLTAPEPGVPMQPPAVSNPEPQGNVDPSLYSPTELWAGYADPRSPNYQPRTRGGNMPGSVSRRQLVAPVR